MKSSYEDSLIFCFYHCLLAFSVLFDCSLSSWLSQASGDTQIFTSLFCWKCGNLFVKIRIFLAVFRALQWFFCTYLFIAFITVLFRGRPIMNFFYRNFIGLWVLNFLYSWSWRIIGLAHLIRVQIFNNVILLIGNKFPVARLSEFLQVNRKSIHNLPQMNSFLLFSSMYDYKFLSHWCTVKFNLLLFMVLC